MRRYLFPLILGIAGCGFLIYLGMWQLERRDWKEGLLADITAGSAAPLATVAKSPSLSSLLVWAVMREDSLVLTVSGLGSGRSLRKALRVLTSRVSTTTPLPSAWAGSECSRWRRAVPALLSDWQRASLAAIRVDPALSTDPAYRWNATVAGASLAQGITARGTDPQGQPVQARAVYFARGAQVFQAAVYGASSDEVNTTFFDGLKLP